MIEFTDSFSQAAVSEALRAHDTLAPLLAYRLMVNSWRYDYDPEDGHRTGGPHVERPSQLHKTVLYVNRNDMDGHLPKEISFSWWHCECDDWGQPKGEWQRTIVGAFFNHGTNEAPNWGSHT